MCLKKSKKILFLCVVLCALVFIQILSLNSDAATSSAPALTGVSLMPGGGGGATPTANGITSGGNAVSAFGAVMPDIFTGTMNYRMPIDVATGRKGMLPGLALTYTSGNGNGWVGVGWDLDVGAIERSGRHGVDFSGDDYVLRKDGAAIELVAAGGGVYHAKIEGDFNRIRQLTDTTTSDGRIYWELTDKTGTRYIYGKAVANGVAVSRQDDPNNADHIFKWCLEQVVDTNGNYMNFSYFKDGNNGQIYLDHIDYTGNTKTSLGTTNHVQFYREARTDAPDMYTTGFKVTTLYRLKVIDVFGNGNRMRAYQLVYQPSGSTGRSVLGSVKQFGKDASVTTSSNPVSASVSGSNSFPLITFGWQGGGTSWSVNPTGGTTSALNPPVSVNDNCLTGDLNGDGITDFWCETSSNSGSWNIYLSSPTGYTLKPSVAGPHVTTPLSSACLSGDLNGDGMTDFWCETSSNSGQWNIVLSDVSNGIYGWTETTWYGPKVAFSVGQYCFTGDLNRDEMTDFWCETASNSGLWNVALSTAGGWAGWTSSFSPQAWFGPKISSPVNNQCFAGDLNGDRMTDFWCETSSPSGQWNVALATAPTSTGWATGWAGWTSTSSPAPWFGPQVSFSSSASIGQYCLIGDLNGDGVADFWCESGSGTGKWNIAMATGSGWAGWTSTSSPAQWNGPAPATPVYNLCLAGDLNTDGETDFWCESTASSGSWNVALSTGTTWSGWTATSSPGQWSGPAVASPLQSYCFGGDFNGDGKTDFWCETSSSSGSWNTAYSNGVSIPDLLVSVQNGYGGTRTISYLPSTQYPNTQLPFPVQTVSSVTVNDGNGNVATTEYSYAGGYFQASEQDFRGFNDVTVTGPSANGVQRITETWFHRGNDVSVPVDADNPYGTVGYMKGKPYRTQIRDANKAIYTETMISYTPNTATGYYFAPPFQVDIYNCTDGKTAYLPDSCAGSGSPQHIQTAYSYDQYGNLTQEDQNGDLADPNQARTIVRNYSPIWNFGLWIIGLPASEIIEDSSGARVAQTNYYYDGVTTCTTTSQNQTPTIGNLTCIARWFDGGSDPSVGMTYDSNGNLIQTQDANGNISRYAYDPAFASTFQTAVTLAYNTPQQQTTNIWYYAGASADAGLYGQINTITDPNSQTTTIQYDALGRKKNISTPDQSWTSWTYSDTAFGNVGEDGQNVEIDTKAGLSSWAYFDGLGRTFSSRKDGPGGKVIAMKTQYNPTGTISAMSYPYFYNPETTPPFVTYIYDVLGQTTSVTNPDNSPVQICYDNGVTVTVDEDGNRKRITKNGQGKIVKAEEYFEQYTACTTDELSSYSTTTYAYDPLGNLRFVNDIEGNQTEMRYDTLSRKIYMHDPDMAGYWSYGYDANGNLTSQTDANNHQIILSYDALNRVTQKHYPTTSFGPDIVYTYDESWSTNAKGRLTTVSAPSGTTQYYYDNMGRPTTVNNTIGGANYAITYAYDSLGRLSGITYPDLEQVVYQYDAGSNLYTVSSTVNNQTTTYASYGNYNALGQPGNIAYGNGVTTAYQYDASRNWLNNITTLDSMSVPLVDLSYSHSFYGNILSIVDNIDSTRSQGSQMPISYDNVNRIQQTQSTSYGGNGVLGYFYDQIGNLTTKDSTINYTYGPAHPHAPATTTSGGQTYTYSYDNNGNMTSDSQRTITYNYDNMPVSVTLNGATTNFVYDGSDNRAMKTTPAGTSIYIGDLYTCLNGVCSKYIFGTGRIAVKSGSDILYYHQDHLGSTLAVTDTTGAQQTGCSYLPVRIAGATPQYFSTIQAAYSAASDGSTIQTQAAIFSEPTLSFNRSISVTIDGGYDCDYSNHLALAQIVGMVNVGAGTVTLDNVDLVLSGSTNKQVEYVQYLPFGQTASDAGNLSVTHRYTSQEFDTETGLYNYHARFYNPAIGKFLSPDAIVPDPWEPQSFNRYSYVLNNPLVYDDPTGQSFRKWLHREEDKIQERLRNPYVAYFIQSIDPVAGTYLLTRSQTGQDILAGEIIVATAVATWECGGCGAASGALFGELSKGYTADRQGKEILPAVVRGGAEGAVTGSIGNVVGGFAPDYTISLPVLGNIPIIQKATSSAVSFVLGELIDQLSDRNAGGSLQQENQNYPNSWLPRIAPGIFNYENIGLSSGREMSSDMALPVFKSLSINMAGGK